MWRTIFLAILCCFVIGCIPMVTEGDKKLIHQTGEAGKVILTSPEATDNIKTVATDIVANTKVLTDNLGPPGKPVPYSPEYSIEARDDAKKEHEASDGLWGFIEKQIQDNVPWGATALSIGGFLYALYRKMLANKKLKSVYEGVEEVKKSVENGKYIDAINTILRNKAVAMNTYESIKTDLKSIRQPS